MAFIHSLLGANLFILIYLAYPKDQFVLYGLCQLIASSLLILLETPLLQYFLAYRNENAIPKIVIRIKACLACAVGIVSIAITGRFAETIVIVVALISTPTSWQVTARTHSKQALIKLLCLRFALFPLVFTGISICTFSIVFAVASSMCASALGYDEDKSLLRSVGKLIDSYRSRITFVIRPVIESIAFNSAAIYVISNLTEVDASMFFIFLRTIAGTVSIAQNALYTELVKPKWQAVINLVGPAVMVIICVVSLSFIFYNMKSIVLNGITYVFGSVIVIFSQYFGNFQVKQLELKNLDILNGVFFVIGLAIISIVSLIRHDFQSTAFTYVAIEAAIGIYSWRSIVRHLRN